MSEHHPLRGWLRATTVSSVLLALTIGGSAVTIAYSIVHWIDGQAFAIGTNEHEIVEVETDIKEIRQHLGTLDKMTNDLDARITAQSVLMDRADTELSHQMKLLEARTNFAAEHAAALPGPRK